MYRNELCKQKLVLINMDPRIESYQRRITELIERCKVFTDTIPKIIWDVTVFDEIPKICAEIQRYLDILKGTENENINIICVGNTSTGKSSLINALIGKSIMPSSALITTRCFTRLSRSDRNMVVDHNGETKICSSDEMVKEVIGGCMDKLIDTKEIAVAVIQVCLDIDSPILGKNVYLYDSPGEGHSSDVSEMIKDRCKDMDIMIIVMPYNLSTDIEKNYETLAKYITEIPVLILINKWDEACEDTTPKQIVDVKESIKSYVKRAFIKPHNIESEIDNELLFYISAKEIVKCYPNVPAENTKCRQRYDDFQRFKSRLSDRIINCKDKRFKEIMNKVEKTFNQQQKMYNTRRMEIRNQFLQSVLAWITEVTGIRMKCDQLRECMDGDVFRSILEQTNHILRRLREIETRLNSDDFDKIYQNRIFAQIKEDINVNQGQFAVAVAGWRNKFKQHISSSIEKATDIKKKCDQWNGTVNSNVYKDISAQCNSLLGLLSVIQTQINNGSADLNSEISYRGIKANIKKHKHAYADAVRDSNDTYDELSFQYDQDIRYFENKYSAIKKGIETGIEEKYIFGDKVLKMKNKYYEAFKECDALFKRCAFASQGPTDIISIMCFGNVSVGKSMIINSILEKNIMTSAGSHTTRCFVRLSKGNTNKVVSPKAEISLCSTNVEIKDAVKKFNEAVKITDGSEIKIYLKRVSQILDNVYLYDTPGLGLDDKMPQFLITKIKDIDIVILVIHNNVPTNIENIFKTIAEHTTEIPIFILVNKWDNIDDDHDNSIAELKEQMKNSVQKICKSKYHIYYVSGKEALQHLNITDDGKEVQLKGVQLNYLKTKEQHLNITDKGKKRRYGEFTKFKSKLLYAIENGRINTTIRRGKNLQLIKVKVIRLREKQYANDRIEFRKTIENLKKPWNNINLTVNELIEKVGENERNLDDEIKAIIKQQNKCDYDTFKPQLESLDKAQNEIHARILIIESDIQELMSDKSRINIKQLLKCVAEMESFKRRMESQSGSWGYWFLNWFTYLTPLRPFNQTTNDWYLDSVVENFQKEYKGGYKSMKDALSSAGDICRKVINMSDKLQEGLK